MIVAPTLRPALALLLFVALSRPGAAQSEPPEQEETPASEVTTPEENQINPAGACALFEAGEEMLRLNRERRESLLEYVALDGHSLWVVHQGDWTFPQPMTIAHLSVVETQVSPEGDATAVVLVDSTENELPCAPGLYRLQVDDSLGPEAQILAIVDGVLLIEWAGELGYLAAPDAFVPEWHMAWHAGWTVSQPRRTTGYPIRPAPPPRKR